MMKRATKPSNSLDRGSRYHRRFALLAAMEAQGVLAIFEKERPNDHRPREAIRAIKAWGEGERELTMAEVRRLSLAAHAAARDARSDAARHAARAAGQAVATWHVPTHAMGAPIYARKAIIASMRAPKGSRARAPRATPSRRGRA